MYIENDQIHCDWLKVTQTHSVPHDPYNAGNGVFYPVDQPSYTYAKSASHKGLGGSNLQISSDGLTVSVEGNPSRWNKEDNLFGISLDDSKQTYNRVLTSLGLPPFTSGEYSQGYTHYDLEELNQPASYTGAHIQRIDLTANLALGSYSNLHTFLLFQQGQNYPQLQKTIIDRTTYHGKGSERKTLKFYDKAAELRKRHLQKATDKVYIQSLIDFAEEIGISRFEVIYRRFLHKNNLNYWHLATTANLNPLFKKDANTVVSKLDIPNYADLTVEATKVLALYLIGLDVKKMISRSSFYKYRKLIMAAGHPDIGNKNYKVLAPRVVTMEIHVPQPPPRYRYGSTVESVPKIPTIAATPDIDPYTGEIKFG